MRCVIILLLVIMAGCGPKPQSLPYYQSFGRYEGEDSGYAVRLIINNYTSDLFNGLAMFAIPNKRSKTFTMKLEDIPPIINKEQVSVDVRRTVVQFQHDFNEIPGKSYSFVLDNVALTDREFFAKNWRKTILFEDVGKTEPYTTRIYFALDSNGIYVALKIELYESPSGNLLVSIPLKKLP